ncbi:MAG TPA: PRC-barrel domain-containing protein [Thermomicrobiales bacterium]
MPRNDYSLDQVSLGQEIVSRDGEKLGSLDRVVVNAENHHLENLVVHQGIFSGQKLVDIDLIDHIEPERIVLSLSAAEARNLPDFVATQYVEAPADAHDRYKPAWAASGLGAGRIIYAGPVASVAYPGGWVPPSGSIDAEPPVVENVSNLPPQDVMISEGTSVVGADGEKLGKIDRVIFGDGGALSGLVVKVGFLFKRDVTIPIDAVAEVGTDRIRLNVPAKSVQRHA